MKLMEKYKVSAKKKKERKLKEEANGNFLPKKTP